MQPFNNFPRIDYLESFLESAVFNPSTEYSNIQGLYIFERLASQNSAEKTGWDAQLNFEAPICTKLMYHINCS